MPLPCCSSNCSGRNSCRRAASQRQLRDHLHDALGEPGMAREMIGRLRRRRRDPRGEREQRRRGLVDIAFQRRHGRHRIVVEIELVLVDQPRQRLDRQAEFADRQQQFGRDRIALDAAMAVRPPACRSTIAAAFRPAAAGSPGRARGNLDIEGVDRQQRAALAGRHEQRRGVAGKIVAAHQIGAEGGGILRRRGALMAPRSARPRRAAARPS